jgi:hypothetical protein
MTSDSPEAQLAGFVAKFNPEIAALAKACLAKMRKRLPGATQAVYDNYNALAIGFGSSDRVRDVIFSIAVYPRWVSLFFFHGIGLNDPHKLLKGSGNQVRHIVLKEAALLDEPAIVALMDQALLNAKVSNAKVPIHPKAVGSLVIKSVSAKQRPRRPAK